jgi:hypothetical protein
VTPEDAACLALWVPVADIPIKRRGKRDAVMNTTDAAGLRSLRETFDRAAAMIASA